MTQLPIPVHVGSEPPGSWDDIEARQREVGDDASPWLRGKRRPAVAGPGLGWGAIGFEPRWVGFDTADCVAALQPSIFHGRGADEFDRFRQGATSRSELALVISLIGDLEGEPRSVLTAYDGSIHLGRIESSVVSRPLGVGARIRAAAQLEDADSHLARQLINCNPPLPWRALSLHGVTAETYNGSVHYPAQGSLEPILETELGEPVVAAWVAPDGVERRYVVPVETPWPLILQWLLDHALPEYVPDALRRARRPLANDDTLMSQRERTARRTLGELEARHRAERAELERELAAAEAAGAPIRDGLLYGTGSTLVDAVRVVLEAAGVTVVNLDDALGGTKNADLLCSHHGRARLVEVKSASGSAPERAYEDLVRHLREWETLPASTPVEGGVLVVNHQHRLPPRDRNPRPYGRPEFLAAQTEPVITTLELFAAWREEDWQTIHAALFGDPAEQSTPMPGSDHTAAGDAIPGGSPSVRERSWWRRRRDGRSRQHSA